MSNPKPTYPTLAAAFVAAQAHLTHVVKNKTGQARGATYKYADLADLVEMLRPLLHTHGLAFQSINAPATGGALVKTRLLHESGEMIESEGTFVPASDLITRSTGEVTPAGSQQYGSAYTYARRYDLIAFLGIAADDDDGAAAMNAQAKRVQASVNPDLTSVQEAALISKLVEGGMSPSAAKAAAKATTAAQYDRAMVKAQALIDQRSEANAEVVA